jgi:hypothetical protein
VSGTVGQLSGYAIWIGLAVGQDLGFDGVRDKPHHDRIALPKEHPRFS